MSAHTSHKLPQELKKGVGPKIIQEIKQNPSRWVLGGGLGRFWLSCVSWEALRAILKLLDNFHAFLAPTCAKFATQDGTKSDPQSIVHKSMSISMKNSFGISIWFLLARCQFEEHISKLI